MGAVLITLGGGKAPCRNREAGAAYTLGCDARLSLPGHPLNLALACDDSSIRDAFRHRLRSARGAPKVRWHPVSLESSAGDNGRQEDFYKPRLLRPWPPGSKLYNVGRGLQESPPAIRK